MDDELRRLIEAEYPCRMSDELYDCFAGKMTEVRLKNKEALIRYGKLDTNLYIHKSGIIRVCWFDGETEKTYGFSSPGNVIISYHSHFMNKPSYFQFESCSDSVVMKVSKKDVDELVEESSEFAKWMMIAHLSQLYFNELRFSLVNGTAKDSYIELLNMRPHIVAGVPMKIIASYLGVTPNYLSHLKRNWLKKQ
jgi:CRP-like cAMP-binding protein